MTSPVIQSRIVNRLRLARGGVVSIDELAKSVWFDDAGGGPLWAIGELRVLIHRLRKKGFPIKNYHGRGYYFAPTLWEVVA
jgi:DNA-binding winged helix-turn-helix (wHTH) protein